MISEEQRSSLNAQRGDIDLRSFLMQRKQMFISRISNSNMRLTNEIESDSNRCFPSTDRSDEDGDGDEETHFFQLDVHQKINQWETFHQFDSVSRMRRR